jgi:hypothetical protein
MATSSETYVGIDVSKDRLDVAVLGEQQAWQVENTCQGIENWCTGCKSCNPSSSWWKPRVATNALSWMPCSMQGYVWRW